MLNRLEGNANKAVDRYIELNPDKEDIAMTMMQHLEESIKNKVAPDLIAQGEQVGAEKRSLEIAKSMLLEGADETFVVKTTGLAFDVVAQIKQSITH